MILARYAYKLRVQMRGGESLSCVALKCSKSGVREGKCRLESPRVQHSTKREMERAITPPTPLTFDRIFGESLPAVTRAEESCDMSSRDMDAGRASTRLLGPQGT